MQIIVKIGEQGMCSYDFSEVETVPVSQHDETCGMKEIRTHAEDPDTALVLFQYTTHI